MVHPAVFLQQRASHSHGQLYVILWVHMYMLLCESFLQCFNQFKLLLSLEKEENRRNTLHRIEFTPNPCNFRT